MDKEALKAFLDEKYAAYNQPAFIPPDPISVPHRYSRKEDIEIAGLLAATIAWGRRDLIIRAGHRMLDQMGESPLDFVLHAGPPDLEPLQDFVYRTFQGQDLIAMLRGLQHIYRNLGGLEAVMSPRPGQADTLPAIMAYREAMTGVPDFPQRTGKHLANPLRGSSAKRLNMFLRWMVRRDGRGVDFGLWKSASPAQLVCPLDVHTGNVGRQLGLLSRKQNDWKAAMELTMALRDLDAEDPVKYDFALFGLGINEGF